MHSYILTFSLLIGMGGEAVAQTAVPELAFPDLPPFDLVVDLADPPDGEDRLFVVQHKGKVYSVANTPEVTTRNLFLDITERVGQSTEQGIYGIAFHPEYEENGFFYLHYLTPAPFRSVIARYQRSASDPTVADPESETIILELEQPDATHSGGQIAFGPDGYFYIAFGDGGCCGDPDGNGQDRATLYGTVLRLDVGYPSGGRNYGIPSDNPFVGNVEGWREEIYAYGFRNPWRFSFDRLTGELWLGDVGEASWEEIDRVEPGLNYGWSVMEGPVCVGGGDCDQMGLTLPLYAYDRAVGSSITGGYVYRGSRLPDLYGKYIYGDFVSGTVWALDYSAGEEPTNQTLFDTDLLIPTFGEDEQGELYFANFFGSQVYRIVDPEGTAFEEGSASSALRLSPASPNPIRGRSTLRFSLAEPGPARVAVYDVLGREIAVLYDGVATAAEQTVTFDATGLAAGLYVVRFEAAGAVASRRVTVVR